MTSTTPAVRVHDALGFEPLLPAAADVYGVAMGRSAELVAHRRSMMHGHLRNAGFVAVAARGDEDDLMGFGYGYLGMPGQWWHDAVADALGPTAARSWLTGSFEVAELHVRPRAQGRGLGRALLDELLRQAGERAVVLSTHDRESPARRLYRSCGFVDLLTAFRFPGGTELFAVMGRQAG